MSVQVATLDILTEQGHFEPEVARAIGNAIDMEIAFSSNALATREDVKEVRVEIWQLAIELRGEMSQLSTDLRSEMSELRGVMKHLRTELRAEKSQHSAEL